MINTKEKTNTNLLASFSTLKGLADESKFESSYQILREFIKYIVHVDSLYAFSAVEMKQLLYTNFGFQIPEAVIKSTAKNTNWLSLKNGMFYVQTSGLKVNPVFQEEKDKADKYSSDIFNELSEYIKSRTQDSIDKECLLKELVCFLIDDTFNTSNKYTDYIGEFILQKENDTMLLEGLDKIREGSVLFIGLSNNISEVGSISKPLNLYLGTEILFSLVGYNGTIYQQLSNDFFEQVRLANTGGKKKIRLYYFSEVKKEIEDFFATAESIVKGNKQNIIAKTAMKAITDGCKSETDVAIKQADFFNRLRNGFGIVEDPVNSYYGEEFFTTNLEYIDDEDDETEEDNKQKKEASLRLISHINKLRAGETYSDEFDAEHIIISNSNMTLTLSREQSIKIKEEQGIEKICDFAIPLNKFTNLLWFKLGSGFTNRKYPTSVSALIKARVVLSAKVAKETFRVFKENQKKYECGELTDDQLIARIVALKGKPKTPEELRGDEIVEAMDFSPEAISRYEEEYKNNQLKVKEQESIINTLKNESEKSLSEKDKRIAKQEEIIKDQKESLLAKDNELDKYRRKEFETAKRKRRRKKIIKYIVIRVLILLLIVAVTFAGIFVDKKFSFPAFTILACILDSITIVITVFRDIKNAKNYLFDDEQS